MTTERPARIHRPMSMRIVIGVAAAASLAAVSPARAAEKGTLSYQLTVQPESVKAKAGDKGRVTLVLKPQGPAHVDPRAPLSLEAKSGGAVALDKTQLKYADAKEGADKTVEFDVPFTARSAGSDKIEVHADFFLCTPKICERQITDVSVPVTVE